MAKKKKKKNKYAYLFVVQGHSDTYGWEDLCQSEIRKEAKTDLRAYRENQPGSYRIIRRRELNTKK